MTTGTVIGEVEYTVRDGGTGMDADDRIVGSDGRVYRYGYAAGRKSLWLVPGDGRVEFEVGDGTLRGGLIELAGEHETARRRGLERLAAEAMERTRLAGIVARAAAPDGPVATRSTGGEEADIEANHPGGHAAYRRDEVRRDGRRDPQTKGFGLDAWEE